MTLTSSPRMFCTLIQKGVTDSLGVGSLVQFPSASCSAVPSSAPRTLASQKHPLYLLPAQRLKILLFDHAVPDTILQTLQEHKMFGYRPQSYNLCTMLEEGPDILLREKVMFRALFSCLGPHIVQTVKKNKVYVYKQTISCLHPMQFRQLPKVGVVDTAYGLHRLKKCRKCSRDVPNELFICRWKCSIQVILLFGH